MPRTLKFYGASDDLFEIEGTRGDEPDEIGCYDGIAAVEIIHQEAESGVRILGEYAPGKVACWRVSIEPLDEDVPIPGWPISMALGGRGYSPELTIEVPDGVTIRDAS